VKLLSELLQDIAGRMQENHRNGQDDSDITETSEPFTATWAALNRHIILSADNDWLKHGTANQPGSNLSASRSGSEGTEKVFEEVQVSYKMFVANKRKCSTQEIICCVMVFIQAIRPV